MVKIVHRPRAATWTYNAIAPLILKTTSLALPDTGRKYTEGPDILPRRDAAYWDKATRDFEFSAEDRVPADLMNKLMWEGLMPGTPYPTQQSGVSMGILELTRNDTRHPVSCR